MYNNSLEPPDREDTWWIDYGEDIEKDWLNHIATKYTPGEVFSEIQLEQWAIENKFKKIKTMSKEKTAAGSGLGFGTVLFLIFLVLKLCDKITWSWWWVCAPLWIPFALIILILLVLIVAHVIINR